MELHKAVKEIVASKGADMICNPQIINYLLDYQAFKEKPATKLILRAIIDSGYAESILALVSNSVGWETKYKLYQQEFINSYGYNEDLVTYVFDSIAYGIGWKSDIFCLLDNDKNISLNTIINEQEHLKFMGIPLDGNIVVFVEKMQGLGFILDDSVFLDWKEYNSVDMTGKFAGMDKCRISVYSTSKTHTVWSVSVQFFEIFATEPKKTWEVVKKRYYILKDRLAHKYGNPGYCK